jgi:hypothetical protein
MSRIRKLLLNLFLICMGLALIPLVLEIGLRFFPVFSGMPVNRTSDIYSFTPNVTIQRSSNWDMSNPRKRQVNNAGFISDQGYKKADKTPLIAIVGDSYIEAMQVDYSDTAEAHLLTKCAPHARIYSFGAQFAPLSQYLSWAQYASQTYDPKIMVVNIVGNDFDESLLSHQLATNNGGVPGMQFYDFSNDSTRLVTIPFKQESWFTQVLRHSVLAQYLVRNVGVVNIMDDYRNRVYSWGTRNEQSKANPEQSSGPANAINSARNAKEVRDKVNTETSSEYVGNAKRAYSTEKLLLAKKAVDSFLSDLPKAAHLPAGSIVLTVDAERPLIYSPAGQHDLGSFFSVMRQYLIEHAKSLGFIVLDLRLAMIKQFSAEGRRFEFPDDNHWNAVGHRLLADQLYQVPTIQAICQNRSP